MDRMGSTRSDETANEGSSMSSEEHDIAEALKAAGSAAVTSVLNRKGIWRSWMKGPKPLAGHPRACGPAFTLSFVPAREDLATPQSYTAAGALRDSLEQVPEGAMVVCDGRGCQDMGIIGDMYGTRLFKRGAAGFVTDTPVRDGEGVALTGLSVWCTGVSSPASIHGIHFTAQQQVIGCGGVAVVPGDFIVADSDGVVVVPRAIAAEIAASAVGKAEREPYILSQLKEGRALYGLYPPDEALEAEYQAWKQGRG